MNLISTITYKGGASLLPLHLVLYHILATAENAQQVNKYINEV